jgi:Flp pilus assembly protein TadG
VKRQRQHRERGAIAVIAAILFVVVGGMLALSLNVGHKMEARALLAAAFDAAALAGARELDGSAAGLTRAKASAVTYATTHKLDRNAVGVSTSDVEVGYWDKAALRFYADGETVHIGDSDITLSSATTAQYYNAVKVSALTDGTGSHNQPLTVWFANFVGGISTMKVGASAVAIGGGPCSNGGCTLPMAVPSCALLDSNGNIACGTTVTLYFNHGHGKDIALADITQPSHSVDNFEERTQMAAGAACTTFPAVKVGDQIALGNGSDFTSQITDNMQAPNDIICNNGVAPYVGCPRRQLAVVNIGTNCSVPMNSEVSIVGFVNVVITNAVTNPGNLRSLDVYIDCTSDSPTSTTGCATFGFGARRFRLVQ